MSSAEPRQKASFRALASSLLVLAFIVRLPALLWNTRLFGDVNLYALVARTFNETGALNYPAKFDFFDPAPYLALATPVSQHPPAWSWFAALLARLPFVPDEFGALKLLSLFCGLAVVLLGTLLVRQLAGPRLALISGLLLALHPLLIDFSANGSPYLAVAAGSLALTVAATSTLPPVFRALIAASGAALAAHTHGLGALLAVAGLIALLPATPRPQRLLTLSLYTLLTLLFLAPLFAWNLARFGSLLHSTSTAYIPGKLGLVSLVNDPAGLHYAVTDPTAQHLLPYTALALKTTARFLLHLALETGFSGLAFACIGAFSLFRTHRRHAAALLILLLAVAVPCLAWPDFKFRFLLPALPFVLLLAPLGIRHLLPLHPRLTRLGIAAALLTPLIVWTTQFALTGSPARYYAFDLKHRSDYALMREAADVLRAQPPGVVLSFPTQLDGGVEALWFHRHPAVLARGFPLPALQRLTADFAPAYFLLSASDRATVATLSPGATPLFENSAYLLYRQAP